MTHTTCPKPEELFSGLLEDKPELLAHVEECERCQDRLEEDGQLEKDLFRLADPLPPAGFVHLVMAKVATSRAPASEIRAGLSILFSTVLLSMGVFVARGGGLVDVGTSLASGLLHARPVLVGLSAAALAVWKTAAIPLTLIMILLLTGSLAGLKRLVGPPLDNAKVTT